MANFELELDITEFRKGILALGNGYKAMRETLRVKGYSESINSRRKKNEYEDKKPPHGRFIAWIMARISGRDIFELKGSEADRVLSDLSDGCVEAIHRAYDKERSMELAIRGALLIAAQEWAEIVVDRVKDGYLGKNQKKALALKENLAKYGYITSKYGVPAPRGIRTGRWIEGIRGRWRLGRVVDAGEFEVR